MSTVWYEACADLVGMSINTVREGVQGCEARLTTPMFRSTVAIRLFAPAFKSLLVMIFSTARTTPSLHLMPIAVPPFSTALTAYST